MKKSYLKVGVLILLALVAAVVLQSGLVDYLSLESLKTHRNQFKEFYNEHPVLTILSYIAIYTVTTALSLPGATILTLAGGALFGVMAGAPIVALSATLGATLAFLSARFVLRDTLESKYAAQLSKFNDGISKGAANYILFVRLVPLFPFFLINLVFGLTRVPIQSFFIWSFVGMIPGTIVYTNLGAQLATITSLNNLVSPNVIVALSLLGTFALIPTLYNRYKKKS